MGKILYLTNRGSNGVDAELLERGVQLIQEGGTRLDWWGR